MLITQKHLLDFPGGIVAKNLPSNAGDLGSIMGQRTKIPHALEQLHLPATIRGSVCLNKDTAWQLRPINK